MQVTETSQDLLAHLVEPPLQLRQKRVHLIDPPQPYHQHTRPPDPNHKLRLTKPHSSPGLTTSFGTVTAADGGPDLVGEAGLWVERCFVWAEEEGARAAVWAGCAGRVEAEAEVDMAGKR